MGSVDRQFDTIVVGAGPAGSMAALTLARSQRRVLLVDRSTFPRDKVCGDGLPPTVMESLQQVGICVEDLGVRNVDYKVIEGLEIGSPAQKTIQVHWRPAAFPTLACRRIHFDTVLFEKAIQHGAQFLHAHVKDLIFHGDQLVGVQTRDQGDYCAEVVVAADGYGSSTARNAGFQLPKGSAVVSAIRAYARLKKPIKPYFYMHFLSDLRPGYAWLFPVSHDLANVGLGLTASHLNSQSLRESLVRYLCDWWDDSVELQADTFATVAYSIMELRWAGAFQQRCIYDR